MTAMRTGLWLLIVLMIPSRILCAQDLTERYMDARAGVTVDEAVRQALEREPGLQAVRGEIEVARGQRTQAALRANPMLTFERREEAGGTDNATTAQVEWPLELFRRSARVGVAQQQVDVAERLAADRARLLAADVRMRYGDAAAAIRRGLVAERARDSLSRQAAVIRARVNEGAVPPLEGDQIDVEVRRAEVDALLAAADVEVAMLALKRSVGLVPEAPLRLRESIEALVSAAPVSAERGASDRRADVLVAEAEQRLVEAKVTNAQADGRVDLSVFAGYMRMDSGFPQFGVNSAGLPERVHGVFHNIAAGATIAVPLRNRNQGAVAAARAEQATSARRLEAVRLGAAEELASADVRVRESQRALAVSAGAVTLADKNRGVVAQTYTLGRATLNEVLIEERRYIETDRAHTSTLKAVYDALVAARTARGEQ